MVKFKRKTRVLLGFIPLILAIAGFGSLSVSAFIVSDAIGYAVMGVSFLVMAYLVENLIIGDLGDEE